MPTGPIASLARAARAMCREPVIVASVALLAALTWAWLHQN